jgi:peptidoglycan/xylan/chitin deacetylase (PgdA/CDA1 family)
MKTPKTAKYLLRFDDLCPTMNWKVWSEIEAALVENQVKPILAVVPDNLDPKLQVDAPAAHFWERVRQWQARDWAIGLHGFQHKYIGQRVGIVTPKKNTEFAGVPEAEQAEMLRNGVHIFKRHGITPRVWIAPSNSFDATTVALLPQFGIHIICDGLFRFPFVCRRKMFWIPHQIFNFRPAPPGVWTVCFHHNHWTAADLKQFRENLRRFRDDLWTLDDVLQVWAGHRSWWSAQLANHPRFSQQLLRVELKLWEWWQASQNKSRPVKPALIPAKQGHLPN